MLLGQVVSIAPLVLLLKRTSGRWVPTGAVRVLGASGAVGGLAALAMVSYVYATREAALAPVMIAIALYPALPVVLALLVLQERLSRPQIAGLVIAAVVLPLINMAG